VLLMRSSGEQDIVVGTPVSGRNRSELEGLVGFFVNTLVLRNDLSGRPTFRELVQRVRRSTLAAIGHQELPFEKLVEELAPQRDLGRNPLFQVFVNLIDVSGGAGLQLPGLQAGAAGVGGAELSKFDLTLYLFVNADELTVRLNTNSDLWDAAGARAMLGHYGTLLQAVASDADRPITALPLVRPEERLRLLSRRNPDVVAHGYAPFVEAEQSVGARFAEQVQRDPEQLALETPDGAWTYAEVDVLARRTAAALTRAPGAMDAPGAPGEARDPGAAATRRVALLIGPGGRQVSGMLGALFAGHAYVPLDPDYPEAWLRFVLHDSGAAAIVAEGRHADLARRLAGTATVIDLDALEQDGSPHAGVLPHVAPDTLAYIRYTSGSTGRPKGVMQSQRGLLAHIRAYTNALHIDARDRLSAFSSYTHDGGLMDVYAALLNGATLCPLSLRERTPPETADLIEALGITVYHSTPSAFRHLARGWPAGRRFPRVRLLVFGGEEPRPDDLLLHRAHFLPE
jgi:non-ribosomal peptide synthetase component F